MLIGPIESIQLSLAGQVRWFHVQIVPLEQCDSLQNTDFGTKDSLRDQFEVRLQTLSPASALLP